MGAPPDSQPAWRTWRRTRTREEAGQTPVGASPRNVPPRYQQLQSLTLPALRKAGVPAPGPRAAAPHSPQPQLRHRGCRAHCPQMRTPQTGQQGPASRGPGAIRPRR